MVSINDSEYNKFGFETNVISFEELKEKISIEHAREALLKCNEIARNTDLSKLTIQEIDVEINALRNAKNSDRY